MDKLKITYYVDDGYINDDRPMMTEIDIQDIDGSMSDEDISEYFDDFMQEIFEQNVTYEVRENDREKFLKIAKEHRDRMNKGYEI